MYTDNPLADFYRHDAKQTEYLERLPVCAECGEPIQTDECYEINGEIICPDCLKENYRHWTENYIKE